MTKSAQEAHWSRLFQIACALIGQVNAKQQIIDDWTFGGGTALMLQIGHRESHDVDIFLSDPQFLPFLDPQKHDFKFEIWPTDYGGDGASIKPRDIFDIAAAGERHEAPVLEALRDCRDEVAKTLRTIETMNPDFVRKAIGELAIKPGYLPIAKTALERATAILRTV